MRVGARVAVSKPVESLAAWEASSGQKVCQVARNGKCEPKGDWRRREGCAEHGADGKPACKVKARAPPVVGLDERQAVGAANRRPRFHSGGFVSRSRTLRGG